jgi:hypothetical protein
MMLCPNLSLLPPSHLKDLQLDVREQLQPALLCIDQMRYGLPSGVSACVLLGQYQGSIHEITMIESDMNQGTSPHKVAHSTVRSHALDHWLSHRRIVKMQLYTC